MVLAKWESIEGIATMADGVDAGHYMLRQNTVSVICDSSQPNIFGALQFRNCRQADIPSFIDIGTPEGLERARREIK